MMPIGPLMIEHRLIERMIKMMEIKMQNIGKDSKPDILFIEDACDFLKTYADRCHHGKEENILFFELKDKNLSGEHREILNQLINEHKFARKTTSELATVNQEYKNGINGSITDIYKHLKTLTDLYPEHIKKEDKIFFIPSMGYFTDEEKDEMLDSFWEFDRSLIHEKYKSLVSKYDKNRL
jgi:hemerythrin-like domain-containing protein